MDFVNSFFHIPKKMLIVYFKFYHINGCCTAPVNSTLNLISRIYHKSKKNEHQIIVL